MQMDQKQPEEKETQTDTKKEGFMKKIYQILLCVTIVLCVCSYAYAEKELFLVYEKSTGEIITAGHVDRDRDNAWIGLGDNSTTLNNINKILEDSKYDVLYIINQPIPFRQNKKTGFPEFTKKIKHNNGANTLRKNFKRQVERERERGRINRRKIRAVDNDVEKLQNEIKLLGKYKKKLPRLLTRNKDGLNRFNQEVSKRQREAKHKNPKRVTELKNQIIPALKNTITTMKQDFNQIDIDIAVKTNEIENKYEEKESLKREYAQIMANVDYYLQENKKELNKILIDREVN